jgi:hypothetical protein
MIENRLKVQRTVTCNKRYFGALHLTKRYVVGATNIKVLCTSKKHQLILILILITHYSLLITHYFYTVPLSYFPKKKNILFGRK